MISNQDSGLTNTNDLPKPKLGKLINIVYPVKDDEARTVLDNFDQITDPIQQGKAKELLTRYQAQCERVGRKPFEPTTEERAATQARMESLFGGLDKLDQAVPEDKRTQFAESLKLVDDPDETKAQMANQAYMMHLRPDLAGAIGDSWDLVKRDAAKSLGIDKPDGVSDKELYSTFSGQVQKTKDERAEVLALQQHIATSMFEGRGDWHEAYSEFMKSAKAIDPKNVDQVRQIAEATAMQVSDKARVIGPVVQKLIPIYQGAATGESMLGLIESKNDIVNAVKGLDPEDTRTALNFAAMAAARQHGESTNGAIGKGAEAISRSAYKIYASTKSLLQERLTKMPSTPEEAAFRQQEQIWHDAMTAYETGVDPNRANSWAGNALLNLVGAIPNIGLIAQPEIGLPVLMASNTDQRTKALVSQGANPESARMLGTLQGAFDTGINFVTSNMVLGKVPGLKLGGTSLPLNIAKIGATEVGGLALLNTAGQLTPVGLQQMAHMVDSQIPDAKLGDEIKKMKDALPETVATTFLMAAIGTGMGAVRERSRIAGYTADVSTLQAAGFSEAQAIEIAAKPSIERILAIADSWGKREGTPEERASGIADINSRFRYTIQSYGEGKQHLQITDIPAADRPGVDTLDQLREKGFDLPDAPKGLPTGIYSLGQIRNILRDFPSGEGIKAVRSDDGLSYTITDPNGKPIDHAYSAPEAQRMVEDLQDKSEIRQQIELAKELHKMQQEGNAPSAYAMYAVPQGVVHLMEMTQAIKDKAPGFWNALTGKSAPRTSAASIDSANALVRYAHSKIAAREVANAMSGEVLGDRWQDQEFARKLGAVLVQDRLYAIKKGLEEAAKKAETLPEADKLSQQADAVTEIMKPAEFKAALADPDIAAAIDRHKQTVQAEAEKFHTETGGRMAGKGLYTDAFVNLKAVMQEDQISGGASKGNLANPLKKGSRFNKRATGGAEAYETDYNVLANRMIEGNYAEFQKRELYKQLEKDGLGKITGPGDDKPDFGRHDSVAFPINRGGGKYENLWVRSDIAPEFRQAINTDGQIGKAALVRIAHTLNALQIAGPTDAVFHLANMISVISRAQGGESFLVDLARQVPGVNIAHSLTQIVTRSFDVMRNDPAIRKELAQLAQIGALRGEHVVNGSALNPLTWGARLINLVDKSGRLVMNGMYDNLVKRGLTPESEAGRREFSNQLGQYNSRLSGKLESIVKEAGLSPFIVAGKTMNRNAVRAVLLDPGVQASNPTAALQMRLMHAAGAVMSLVVMPAVLNYLMTGKVEGRRGTPFGSIDTGKNDDQGNMITIDPNQLNLMRRGLRITGMNAVANGLKQDQPDSTIIRRAASDIIGGVVHPYAGPAVNAIAIASTGYSATGHKVSKEAGHLDTANVKEAAKQLNPTVGAFFEGKDATTHAASGVGNVAKQLAGSAGVKFVRPLTAEGELRNAVTKYEEAHKIKRFESPEESRYATLKQALRKGNVDKAVDELAKLVADNKERGKNMRDLQLGLHQSIFSKLLGSAKDERAFLRTLDAQGLQAVKQMKEDRQVIYAAAMAIARGDKDQAQRILTAHKHSKDDAETTSGWSDKYQTGKAVSPSNPQDKAVQPKPARVMTPATTPPPAKKSATISKIQRDEKTGRIIGASIEIG